MSTETTSDKKLQDEIKESAHRIWLAGLGALAAAEQEGGKLFTRLVEKGRDVETRGKQEVDKAKERAESTWEDVSKTVDEKVTAALHRLGVPTRDEIRTLTQRVEELNAKVEQLKPKATAPVTAATPTLVTPEGTPVDEVLENAGTRARGKKATL